MESQKTRQPDQKERKRDVMYNPKSLKAEEFISDEEIRETLAYADANKDNIETDRPDPLRKQRNVKA